MEQIYTCKECAFFDANKCEKRHGRFVGDDVPACSQFDWLVNDDFLEQLKK